MIGRIPAYAIYEGCRDQCADTAVVLVGLGFQVLKHGHTDHNRSSFPLASSSFDFCFEPRLPGWNLKIRSLENNNGTDLKFHPGVKFKDFSTQAWSSRLLGDLHLNSGVRFLESAGWNLRTHADLRRPPKNLRSVPGLLSLKEMFEFHRRVGFKS